jgi:RNA polymerase sigma-70 factor (ECF subfamily)
MSLDGPVAEPEAILVEQAQRDRRAFAPLYARYVDPVYRYCYRRLGSRHAAEDATSRVFTQALAGLPGFRGGSFAGWLFAIAHNVVANDRSRRRPEVPLHAAGTAGDNHYHLDRADPAPTPEEAAIRSEAGEALRDLLAQLPDGQRSVVELRLAGLTGAEVATALGRSAGAVKMLQFRALTRLRKVLGATGLGRLDEPPGVPSHAPCGTAGTERVGGGVR